MKNIFLKMLFASFAALVLLSAGPLRSGESVDLSGAWKFSTEDNASFAKADLDDSSWKSIRLPGFWQRQGFEGHSGYAWARRKMTIPSGPSAAVSIRMDGLYDEAEIFVNGERVGAARGAIGMNANLFPIPEPALVDVSGKFKSGENVIAIRFYDNPSKGEWIWHSAPFPSAQGLAGIEKRISLEMVPAVFIRNIFIRATDKASTECRFQFEVALENKGKSPVAAILFLDASGKSAEKKVSVAPGRTTEILEVKSRPEFGSKTYRLDLKSEAGFDSVSGNWHSVKVPKRNASMRRVWERSRLARWRSSN